MTRPRLGGPCCESHTPPAPAEGVALPPSPRASEGVMRTPPGPRAPGAGGDTEGPGNPSGKAEAAPGAPTGKLS